MAEKPPQSAVTQAAAIRSAAPFCQGAACRNSIRELRFARARLAETRPANSVLKGRGFQPRRKPLKINSGFSRQGVTRATSISAAYTSTGTRSQFPQVGNYNF
jgi:hypothetical protein